MDRPPIRTAAVTLLELTLSDRSGEEPLLAWWDEVCELVTTRFRATEAELATETRGTYVATIGFGLPGIWKLVTQDRRWQELEQTRPAATLAVRQLRRWHRTGNPRDITTTELRKILAVGDARLLDVRSPEAYEAGHLPGAVRVPDVRDPALLASLAGPDKERTLVTYCAGYG